MACKTLVEVQDQHVPSSAEESGELPDREPTNRVQEGKHSTSAKFSKMHNTIRPDQSGTICLRSTIPDFELQYIIPLPPSSGIILAYFACKAVHSEIH